MADSGVELIQDSDTCIRSYCYPSEKERWKECRGLYSCLSERKEVTLAFGMVLTALRCGAMPPAQASWGPQFGSGHFPATRPSFLSPEKVSLRWDCCSPGRKVLLASSSLPPLPSMGIHTVESVYRPNPSVTE